jgi:hypothetical protein
VLMKTRSCAAPLTLAVDPVAIAILEALVLTLDLIAAPTAASILGVCVRQGSNIPPSALQHTAHSTAAHVSRVLATKPAWEGQLLLKRPLHGT